MASFASDQSKAEREKQIATQAERLRVEPAPLPVGPDGRIVVEGKDATIEIAGDRIRITRRGLMAPRPICLREIGAGRAPKGGTSGR